jgi:hypothetical protein
VYWMRGILEMGVSAVSTSYDSWIHNCFLLVDLKKFSPLKPLSQMNRNLVGSIYLSSK